MANNVKTMENKFVTSLGSGKAALAALCDVFEAVAIAANNDATPIANILVRAEKKGDKAAMGVITRLVKAMWVGSEVKGCKVNIKAATVDSDVRANMAAAVAKGKSFRSPATIKEIVGADDKPKKTLDEHAAAFVAARLKAGDDLKAITVALAKALKKAEGGE